MNPPTDVKSRSLDIAGTGVILVEWIASMSANIDRYDINCSNTDCTLRDAGNSCGLLATNVSDCNETHMVEVFAVDVCDIGSAAAVSSVLNSFPCPSTPPDTTTDARTSSQQSKMFCREL